MKTSKILAIIHSDIKKYDRTIILAKKGLRLTNVSNDKYIFTDYETLSKNIELLSKPPILKESALTINRLDMYIPVVCLDGTIKNTGIIIHSKFNMDLYVYYHEAKFVGRKFYLEKSGFFGDNSNLSKSLNNFLNTLPIVVVRGFLVSLAKSIKCRNFKVVNDYLENNRLITENKNEILILERYINENLESKFIKKLINNYANNELKADREGNVLC